MTAHDAIAASGNVHVMYAAIALVVCFVLQLVACASSRHDAGRLYDTVSGLSVALACLSAYFIRGQHFERQTLATALVFAWGVRLSAYLRARVLPPAKISPIELLFPRLLWGLSSALPTVLCNLDEKQKMDWTMIEKLGLFLAVFGLLFETLADEQKRRWFKVHASGRPSKEQKDPPMCATGLWRLSRHPNYFGEICFQFGIFFICSDAISPGIIVCPVLITVMLMFFEGGMTTIEQIRNHRYQLYPAFLHYKLTTSVLIPCPPMIYFFIGTNVRKLCCCGFDLYDEVALLQNEV